MIYPAVNKHQILSIKSYRSDPVDCASMSGSFLRGSVAVVIGTTPVYKHISYINKTYTQMRWIGETKMDMTDECLKSGILLCTLNFATARPIAFTSLHRHVYTITVRQLLLSSCRRAAQSASSLFFTVPTRHAAAGSRSVYRCPTGGTARPDRIFPGVRWGGASNDGVVGFWAIFDQYVAVSRKRCILDTKLL